MHLGQKTFSEVSLKVHVDGRFGVDACCCQNNNLDNLSIGRQSPGASRYYLLDSVEKIDRMESHKKRSSLAAGNMAL